MLSSEDNVFRCRALIDTNAIEYAFLNRKLARVACDTLEIKSQNLIRSKKIKAFNDKETKSITHDVYSHMMIADHSELIAFMLIINLNNHNIILSYS